MKNVYSFSINCQKEKCILKEILILYVLFHIMNLSNTLFLPRVRQYKLKNETLKYYYFSFIVFICFSEKLKYCNDLKYSRTSSILCGKKLNV